MKKIVIKIGSSIVAPRGKVDEIFVNDFIKDIINLQEQGRKIILVSSGAIACGIDKLGLRRKPQDIASLMALASLGQIVLMDIYAKYLRKHKKKCAQILLTWDDFNDRRRYLNARNTIEKLLEFETLPIINENDTISSEEIRFGDNDRLSALLSDLIGAKALIILSDVDGLYSKEGLIKRVDTIDKKIMGMAGKGSEAYTSGGMITKLEAAKIAASSGIKTIIANGRFKSVVSRIIKGEDIGTVFMPHKFIERARKRWIAFSRKKRGRIFIDRGAKNALLSHNRSLLAVGITDVEGSFIKGDAVDVLDDKGKVIGCGLVGYSSDEIKEIKAKLKELTEENRFYTNILPHLQKIIYLKGYYSQIRTTLHYTKN